MEQFLAKSINVSTLECLAERYGFGYIVSCSHVLNFGVYIRSISVWPYSHSLEIESDENTEQKTPTKNRFNLSEELESIQMHKRYKRNDTLAMFFSLFSSQNVSFLNTFWIHWIQHLVIFWNDIHIKSTKYKGRIATKNHFLVLFSTFSVFIGNFPLHRILMHWTISHFADFDEVFKDSITWNERQRTEYDIITLFKWIQVFDAIHSKWS